MLSKEQIERVQILLTANGRYKGAIDGFAGPQTMKAVESLLNIRQPKALTWSKTRQLVAAAQIILAFGGYTPGAIDGYWGNQTAGAYLEWNAIYHTGKALKLPQDSKIEPVKSEFPPQSQFSQFYGAPGIELERQLVIVETPYDLRIDWNLNQVTRKIRIHPRCANSLSTVLEDILSEYGKDKIKALGLDRFAGSYAHRKMRGGSSWSTHAYGAAIDWYAAPNGLTTPCPTALFCKKEYKPFLDIWESHGWTSLGRAINRDYMHFQAGSIK